jgi:hypothetical protein
MKSMSAHRAVALDMTRSTPAGAGPGAGSGETDAARLARAIHEGIASGDVLPIDQIQVLFGALCKAYALHVEDGSDAPPVPPGLPIPPTEAVAVANGLLRAADVAIFELAMWQSWTGR